MPDVELPKMVEEHAAAAAPRPASDAAPLEVGLPASLRKIRPPRQVKLRLLRRESFLAHATRRAFFQTASKVDACLGTGPRRKPELNSDFTPELFRRLWEQDRATFGVTLSRNHRHNEMSLVAVAAAHGKAAGQHLPNVVFIPPSCLGTCFLRTWKNGAIELYTNRGILMDETGRWYEGRFPIPVRIDMVGTFSSHQNELLRRVESAGIPLLNTSVTLGIGFDKAHTKALLEKLSIAGPKSLHFEVGDARSDDEEATLERIQKFVSQNKLREVVVKPMSGKGGRGISFHPASETKAIAEAVEEMLAFHELGVLVEERIPSLPLYSKKDGTRIDWNIRLIVDSVGVVDWEARTNAWGQAVNLHAGGEVLEVSQLFEKLRCEQPPKFRDFQSAVNKAGLRIARELGAGLLGIDVIWDEHHVPWVIEVNAGPVGGMGSLAKLRKDEGKFKAPLEFLAHIAKKLGQPHEEGRGEFEDQPLFPSPFEVPALAAEFDALARAYRDRLRKKSPKKR